MEPNIIIRRGRPEDSQAVMGLILELAAYEKRLAEVENNAEQFLKDGFGAYPAYYCMGGRARYANAKRYYRFCFMLPSLFYLER
jgi:hypothetical protein